jgi:hypothetical protein
MTNKRLVGMALVSMLVLSACAAAPGSLTGAVGKVAERQAVAGAAFAPTVSVVSQATNPVATQALVPTSTLVWLGSQALSHDEIAEDSARSNFNLKTFALLSNVEQPKSFSRSGTVRKTATGFALEASKGLFKSRADVFVLTGAETVMADVELLLDKKAVVKGTVLNRTVTVDTARGIASLGFLFNWFTKGRIQGRVLGASTLEPIPAVTVSVKSDAGFTFTEVSDDEGEFTVPGLTPGKYTVRMSATGYKTSNALTVDVDAREKVTIEGRLTAAAATP